MLTYELLVIVNTFFFMNLIEYILHKLSHNPKIKILYNIHRKHHSIEFPPSRLTCNKYPLDDHLKNPFIYITIVIWIILYNIISYYTFSIIFIESLIYTFTINFLHQAYHLNDSWLDKYKWFKYRKRIHHIHHLRTKKNLNLVVFTGDMIFNTYIEKI